VVGISDSYASLYKRLSREAGDNNLSFEGYERELTARGAALGYRTRPDLIHRDNGRSGARRDREAFLAWLADARRPEVACLISPHVDRLTREGISGASGLILDTVEGKDSRPGRIRKDRAVRLVTLDGVDSAGNPDSFNMAFGFRAMGARYELDRIRKRNRDTARRMLDAGRYKGGRVPFGYRVVPVDPEKYAAEGPHYAAGYVLVIDDADAEYVREAVRRLLRGDNLGSVVRWSNETGSSTGTSRYRIGRAGAGTAS
jgi:DNA invertase Pin-like site-specific DNA recombinase